MTELNDQQTPAHVSEDSDERDGTHAMKRNTPIKHMDDNYHTNVTTAIERKTPPTSAMPPP